MQKDLFYKGVTMILDVGCGASPKGDVNVDLYFEYPHQNVKIHMDIRADAHYLPFKKRVFSKVIAFEVLEHLKNPHRAILEFKRVAKHEILLTVPIEPIFFILQFLFEKKLYKGEEHGHIHNFSKKRLSKLLISCGLTKFHIHLVFKPISIFKRRDILKIPRHYRAKVII